MPIARLNVGNHCCHESQPATEKSDQVRGFLEILALREVRKEERAGEKSFSSPEPPRRLSTRTRRLCSLRGRRLKGKGKGVLGARPSSLPRTQNPLSLSFQTPATQARGSGDIGFEVLDFRTSGHFPSKVSWRIL